MKKKIISVICIVLAVLVFLKAFTIFFQYLNEKKYYDNIEEIVTEQADVNNGTDYPVPREIDWEKLQSEGTDIVGWIDIFGIEAGYPIVQGRDNYEYLRRTPSGEAASCGSIILNATNNADFSDQNSVIFGHNIKNGSMFGKLKWFITRDAYEKSPYIWIYTPEKDILYKIVSGYTVKISDGVPDTYEIEIDDYDAWYCKMLSLSEKNMEYCEQGDMITLSTCNSNGYSYRTIIQAVAEKYVYH